MFTQEKWIDNVNQKLSIIESILFLNGDPVEFGKLQESLNLDSVELDLLIKKLNQKYSSEDSGIRLVNTDNTLQLVTKPENYEFILQTLKTEKKKPLSKAAYEILAIIAYNEPITRIEIEKIRGVSSISTLQRLLDLNLIEECGRKDVPGLPYLYQTTELFLQMANIKSLEELPSFENFKEKLKKHE